MEMVWICGKLPWFGQCMNSDDFPALIEDAHQPRLPTRPHLATHILWWHGVVSSLQLNIAIPMHCAWCFFKHWEQTRRQRQQFGAFHLIKHLADLFPCGAVDASVCHSTF